MNKKIAALIIFILSLFPININAQNAERKERMAQEFFNLESVGNKSNPFGVLEFLHWNHDWNSCKYSSRDSIEKAILLMKEAGVGWVRVDFLWQDIEPAQGDFYFEKYDMIVDLLSQNNINILGILDYSVDWATSSGEWNCPPKDNRLFVDFSLAVVRRYKNRVKHWEVWNEPDSPIYWKEQDGMKGYCGLLKDVYVALKEEDPYCQVLNGGLANGISSVNRLYENGAKDYFDILNIHIFESPLHSNPIERIALHKVAYKVMSRNGDGHKKIWITEIGCPGIKRYNKTANWFLGENPSEYEQAAFVKGVYTELIKEPYVEKIFWAFFRDCKDHWGNGIDYFGLIRWDYSKKPAFSAYKECYENWRKGR